MCNSFATGTLSKNTVYLQTPLIPFKSFFGEYWVYILSISVFINNLEIIFPHIDFFEYTWSNPRFQH